MVTGELTLQKFNDPDYRRLVELSNSTYEGREIADLLYLKWEYDHNPDGPARIHIAVDGRIIVSQYLVLPRKYFISGSIIKGSLSANTLTHPAYRGRGLFPMLAMETFRECAREQIQFTIGFPNSFSLPVIKKRGLFDVTGNLPLLIRPLNPVRSLVRYLSGRKIKSGLEIDLIVPVTNPKMKDVALLNLPEDETAYNEFLESFNRKKENTTYRSASFMKWRYSDIPLRQYKLLKVASNNKITGLAVIRAKYVYGIRCGILIDFMTTDNDPDSAKLLTAFTLIAKRNDLDLLITTVPSKSAESRLIKAAGFFSVPDSLLPQKLSMIVRKHADNCPADIDDFSKWFITFGDYDIF